MNDLLKLKNDYKKLAKIFIFLDYLSSKIIDISKFSLNRNSIIFNDYKTNRQYYVDFKKVNIILEESHELFLMSMLDELNKLEIFDLIREKKWFPFFFFNLFITFKNGISRDIKISKEFIYNSMTNLSTRKDKINHEYLNYLMLFIENVNIQFLVKEYSNFIDLSYETYIFSREKGECYHRGNQYHSLIFTLKNNTQKLNDLQLLDLSLQRSILMSFKGANFVYNFRLYNDNILNKNFLQSCKKFPEIEKECLPSNNL